MMKFAGMILGDLFLVLAFFTHFMQGILSNFLPESMANFLIENKIAWLILGVFFTFIGMRNIVKAKAAAFENEQKN